MNGYIVCVRFFIKEGKVVKNNRDWIYGKMVLEWVKIKGIEESILLLNVNFLCFKMNEKFL